MPANEYQLLEQAATTDIDLSGWRAEQRSTIFCGQAPANFNEKMFHSLLPSLSPNRKRKYKEEEDDAEMEKWFVEGDDSAPLAARAAVVADGFRTPEGRVSAGDEESPLSGSQASGSVDTSVEMAATAAKEDQQID